MDNYRPRQILLVGLGGIGSRTVDLLMEKVPEEYKNYTQAISIDTDTNEIGALKNIPIQNRIRIGENITIGSYMSSHPDIKSWMIKGDQLDLVRERNTSQGAKQIRMVSRIALHATKTIGNLENRIVEIAANVKRADGKLPGSGLLVMVVCSLAGGTGAGTILQVPIYLEEAIKNSYSSDDLEFECACIMPNTFADTLSSENFNNAKVNAYAVLRELISLNTGRLKRFEFFRPDEVDKSENRCAPYGRVYLFDNKSGEGEAIVGNIEEVHIPLVVDSLYEYLYGVGHGKIASALDNTLARVYSTNGSSIFGAIGRAALHYPRSIYHRYSVAEWIQTSLSETWLYPDVKMTEGFKQELTKAREEGREKPEKEQKFKYYINAVNDAKDANGSNGRFFKEICLQLNSDYSNDSSELYFRFKQFLNNLVTDDLSGERSSYIFAVTEQFYFEIFKKFYEKFFVNNTEIDDLRLALPTSSDFSLKEGSSGTKGAFVAFYNYFISLDDKIAAFAREVMRPAAASKDKFFTEENSNDYSIYSYITRKGFHPIALRCFLYDLFNLLDVVCKNVREISDPSSISEETWKNMLKSHNIHKRNEEIGALSDSIEHDAEQVILVSLAQNMLPEIKMFIKEAKDLFDDVVKVKSFFADASKQCLDELTEMDKRPDMVVAGSPLLARNCWKLLEKQTHEGEEGEEDIIDADMSKVLSKIIYRSYYKHADSNDLTASIIKGDEKITIRTDYKKELISRLQSNFKNRITSKFYNIFPANAVEAVCQDVRVHNCWAVATHNTPHISVKQFVCDNVNDDEFYKEANRLGIKAIDEAETLNEKLSLAIGKSTPRCGLVKQSGNSNFTNRYMILNEVLLPETLDTSEESEEMGTTRDRKKFMDGVPTNRILGTPINMHTGDVSVDDIVMVTVYSGLEPSAFVGLLAPDSDEDDPKEGRDYYNAYRNYISKMVNDPSKITPHLDRSWHVGDRLADITEKHTLSVWKHAARAFVYGFIFDVIVIDDNCAVRYGKKDTPAFSRISESANGIIEKYYATPSEQAKISGINDLSHEERVERLNGILYSIFRELTTNRDIRAAIIEYAEDILERDKLNSGFSFIDGADNAEEVAGVLEYNCILDVLNGYYQGSIREPHSEEGYAKETTQFMFDILLQGIFDQVLNHTSKDSHQTAKSKYEKIIKYLYECAVCDDMLNDSDDASGSDNVKADESPDNNSAVDELHSILFGDSHNKASSTNRPFAKGGIFSKENALKEIDNLLNRTRISYDD